MANTAVGGRGSLTKKLLLWVLLVVQLCFIFCFWLLQTGFPDHTVGDTSSNKINSNKAKAKMPSYKVYEFKGVPAENRVNFIMKKKIDDSTKKTFSQAGKGDNELENVNNFYKDFIELNIERLMNITGMEAEMILDQPELVNEPKNIWCFRKGTLNTSTDTMVYWNNDAQRVQCKCLQYWHGQDCGQPEVIWRVLMLPGKQFKLRQPDKELTPHRLIYMLEGNFHSLDFLELQVKAVDNAIDFFLIFWTSKTYPDVSARRAIQRKLNELIGLESYIFFHCDQGVMNNKKYKTDCNSVEALKYFKENLSVKLKEKLEATDLILYTNEYVIHSWEPLHFLKYYATSEMPLWRFRLKHNVYGFYWQHPQRTHLSGFICSFGYLENIIKFQNSLKAVYSSSTYTIGDLNHFGGWYCQYCQHPDEILKELQDLPIGSSSQKRFQFPNGTRNRFIDSKYLEYLIAQGIYIDGKTRLEKIRQYNDQHFAPTHAVNCKWKYGNILMNLYEAMENDYIIDEAEGGAGF